MDSPRKVMNERIWLEIFCYLRNNTTFHLEYLQPVFFEYLLRVMVGDRQTSNTNALYDGNHLLVVLSHRHFFSAVKLPG